LLLPDGLLVLNGLPSLSGMCSSYLERPVGADSRLQPFVQKDSRAHGSEDAQGVMIVCEALGARQARPRSADVRDEMDAANG
tara:strand:- start:2898 stop:3143 length:246 start_codon:yes stop_codon:yes gene_type:complete